MARPRKQEGGGNVAALPPRVGAASPEGPFVDLLKREFGARFRFELGNDCRQIRVAGYFAGIGCQKTWSFAFGPGWEAEARATIRAWVASRA